MAKENLKGLVYVSARHRSGRYWDMNGPEARLRDVTILEDGSIEFEAYVGGIEKGNIVLFRLSPKSLAILKSHSDVKLYERLEKLEKG